MYEMGVIEGLCRTLYWVVLYNNIPAGAKLLLEFQISSVKVAVEAKWRPSRKDGPQLATAGSVGCFA